MDETCGNCNEGWVCERHPYLPWEHGDCGGAGEPCDCNPGGQVCFERIYATTEELRRCKCGL
jgi:hypothetical protein